MNEKLNESAEKMKHNIKKAYCRIREIDNTIPDEVLDFMKDASIAVLNQKISPEAAQHHGQCKWFDGDKIQPEFIDSKDYSENVLAEVEGFTEIQVMSYALMKNSSNQPCYAWCNCYGDINGDAEFDDNYKVIRWTPIPKLPITNK